MGGTVPLKSMIKISVTFQPVYFVRDAEKQAKFQARHKYNKQTFDLLVFTVSCNAISVHETKPATFSLKVQLKLKLRHEWTFVLFLRLRCYFL